MPVQMYRQMLPRRHSRENASCRSLPVCDAMAPKHQALVEENRDLLAENDTLRTEIVKLRGDAAASTPRPRLLRYGLRPANYARGSTTTSESIKKMPSTSESCGRITKEPMPNCDKDPSPKSYKNFSSGGPNPKTHKYFFRGY